MEHDTCLWCGEKEQVPHVLCRAALVFEEGPVTLADVVRHFPETTVEGTKRT